MYALMLSFNIFSSFPAPARPSDFCTDTIIGQRPDKSTGLPLRAPPADWNEEAFYAILWGEVKALKEGYYSSGKFARMAGVTVRTIRFYDSQNILKPSMVSESGARYYTDADFARLQQILLLKHLGFSLEEIREITIKDTDVEFLLNALRIQEKLVRDRIEQLELVSSAISETASAIGGEGQIDWSRMLDLIHLTEMENSLSGQYRNAANLSARISLHSRFSTNPEGWFPWLLAQCPPRPGQQILELGCGDGSLWTACTGSVPEDCRILLSDISEGMVREARRALPAGDPRFSFRVIDAQEIPLDEDSCDIVIANHVLFYCEDIPKVCRQVRRVLRPGGIFACSTYGAAHMQEITRLVQEFDPRIVLSAEKLQNRFGLENGAAILQEEFEDVELRRYADSLMVDAPQPLIEYVLSCHGNQSQYILDRYREFRELVEQKTAGGFQITKDAGLFLARKGE